MTCATFPRPKVPPRPLERGIGVRLLGLSGVGDIKKKREEDKEIEEVVWE